MLYMTIYAIKNEVVNLDNVLKTLRGYDRQTARWHLHFIPANFDVFNYPIRTNGEPILPPTAIEYESEEDIVRELNKIAKMCK